MNKNLLSRIGATSIIITGALWLSLTGNHKQSKSPLAEEESLMSENGYVIRNMGSELVHNAISMEKYYAVMEAVNKKIEEDKRIAEEKRLAEEKRKQEELRKKEEELRKKQEEKNNLGKFNVSWYTSRCDGCSGVTATGHKVHNTIYYEGYQVAASDWSVIPAYSIIEVEGYGQFIVIDRGGAIRGKKLDLLTSTKQQAYKNGRQNLNVKVLRWGKGE